MADPSKSPSARLNRKKNALKRSAGASAGASPSKRGAGPIPMALTLESVTADTTKASFLVRLTTFENGQDLYEPSSSKSVCLKMCEVGNDGSCVDLTLFVPHVVYLKLRACPDFVSNRIVRLTLASLEPLKSLSSKQRALIPKDGAGLNIVAKSADEIHVTTPADVLQIPSVLHASMCTTVEEMQEAPLNGTKRGPLNVLLTLNSVAVVSHAKGGAHLAGSAKDEAGTDVSIAWWQATGVDHHIDNMSSFFESLSDGPMLMYFGNVMFSINEFSGTRQMQVHVNPTEGLCWADFEPDVINVFKGGKMKVHAVAGVEREEGAMSCPVCLAEVDEEDGSGCVDGCQRPADVPISCAQVEYRVTIIVDPHQSRTYVVEEDVFVTCQEALANSASVAVHFNDSLDGILKCALI